MALSVEVRRLIRTISTIYTKTRTKKINGFLHYGDMTDSTNLIRIIQEVQPDEIYNLAAQSHVIVSFETPEYTANSDALGTLRMLEAIRILGMEQKTLFIRRLHLKCLVRLLRRRRVKQHLFIRAHLMAQPKAMRIG